MNNKKFNKALALAMVATVVTPAAATSNLVFAQEASIADHQTEVILHKLQGEAVDREAIQNSRGDELTQLPEGLEQYDIVQNGQVEFTLYKLVDGDGNSPLISDFSGATYDNQDAPTQVTVDGNVYSLEEVNKQTLDTDSSVNFGKQPNGSYLVVETKHNTGTIGEKEQNLLFSLPLANAAGNGFLDSVHLYPKNETKETEFTLTKYLEESGAVLDGVEFTLYQGTPGNGSVYKIADENGDLQDVKAVTSNGGKITFKNLPTGDYYLVESSLDGVAAGTYTDNKNNDKTLELSPYALNNENNRLNFSVTPENVEAGNMTAELINYIEPDGEKNLVHEDNTLYEEGELHDFSYNESPKFEGKIRIPKNIIGGGETTVNSRTQKQRPYSKFIYKDAPADATKLAIPSDLADLASNLRLSVSIKGQELVAGTDYKVSKNGDGFEIDFITTTRKFIDADGTESELPSVTDTVANAAGDEIVIRYNMELLPAANPDEQILNDMVFTYNNHPTGNEEFDHSFEDDNFVETYGKKFLKTSTQMLGLAENPDEFVGGAKFYIYRDNEGTREYLVEQDGTRNWVAGETAPEGAVELESSNEDATKGQFEIRGLKEGSYFLQEFYAPEGYQINDEDLKFEVGQGTYDGEGATAAHFVNRKDGDMPFTGGQLIIALAGLGVVFFIVKAVRDDKEENKKVMA